MLVFGEQIFRFFTSHLTVGPRQWNTYRYSVTTTAAAATTTATANGDEIGFQSNTTMDDTTTTTTTNLLDDVGEGSNNDVEIVDCRQSLSTPALVGLIVGGVVVGVAILVLIFFAFCYIPNIQKKKQRALNNDYGNDNGGGHNSQIDRIGANKTAENVASISDAGTEDSAL